MNTIFAKILYELEKNHDLVLVTLIAEKGSAPRGTGSQMLVNLEGRLLGTIGGGAVEYDAEQLAKTLVAEKRSCVHDYILRKNSTEDLGMVCGGDVTAYFQFIDHTDSRWAPLAGAVSERTSARMNPVSKSELWATSTRSPTNSRNLGRTSSILGAPTSISSVMPVRSMIFFSSFCSGSTKVWNRSIS